jgi:hypothetical protein
MELAVGVNDEDQHPAFPPPVPQNPSLAERVAVLESSFRRYLHDRDEDRAMWNGYREADAQVHRDLKKSITENNELLHQISVRMAEKKGWDGAIKRVAIAAWTAAAACIGAIATYFTAGGPNQ